MNKLYEEERVRDIANAIRRKSGKEDRFTVADMSMAIKELPEGGLPEETLNITGRCDTRFANNHFAWFLNMYADRINTSNIGRINSGFEYSTDLIELPMDINFDRSLSDIRCEYLFHGCTNLVLAPRLRNGFISNIRSIFSGCSKLEEIPNPENCVFTNLNNSTGDVSCNAFYSCNKLLHLPQSFVENMYTSSTSVSTMWTYNAFINCYNNMEAINLPWITKSTSAITSNAFSNTFTNNYRLSRLTFKKNGTNPVTIKAKTQTIDLTTAGYDTQTANFLTSKSSYDKNVCCTSDGALYTTIADVQAKYDALKTDEYWCAGTGNSVTYDGASRNLALLFSRYNHDSAVETIDSLPDASAYLATTSGTNTVKFKNYSGALTDGGGINDLTTEEIAVAAAKGWTVSIVA